MNTKPSIDINVATPAVACKKSFILIFLLLGSLLYHSDHSTLMFELLLLCLFFHKYYWSFQWLNSSLLKNLVKNFLFLIPTQSFYIPNLPYVVCNFFILFSKSQISVLCDKYFSWALLESNIFWNIATRVLDSFRAIFFSCYVRCLRGAIPRSVSAVTWSFPGAL